MEDVKKVSQKPNESHLDRIYKRLDDIDRKLEHIQADAKMNHKFSDCFTSIKRDVEKLQSSITQLDKPWWKR